MDAVAPLGRAHAEPSGIRWCPGPSRVPAAIPADQPTPKVSSGPWKCRFHTPGPCVSSWGRAPVRRRSTLTRRAAVARSSRSMSSITRRASVTVLPIIRASSAPDAAEGDVVPLAVDGVAHRDPERTLVLGDGDRVPSVEAGGEPVHELHRGLEQVRDVTVEQHLTSHTHR